MSGYKVLGSRIVFEGKVLTLRVDELRMPSGRIVEREIITHGGAVGIVPLTDNGDIIMVKQYRHPIKGLLWEIPAGKLDVDESPEACAKRELIEETGKAPGRLIKLSTFFMTPGYSNEIFHLYVADKLKDAGHEEPEEEIVDLMNVSFDEAIRMIEDGRIEDGKTVAAVGLAKIWLEAREDGSSGK